MIDGHATTHNHELVRVVPADERLTVVAQLVGEALAADPEIQGFRATHLGSRLLTLAEVKPWIEAQATRDGEPARYAEFPVGPDDRPMPGAVPEFPLEHDPMRYLEYLDPAGRPERPVPTAYRGVLERLRTIAEWLAKSCDWSKAGATRYILTGIVYEPPQIRVSRRRHTTLGPRLKFEIDRLLLDVHPTVAAEQVREVYRDARESMRPSRVRVAKRPRTAIVEFVNRERRVRPDMTWEELRASWNAAMPDPWAYTAASNLQRDYARAVGLASQ